MSSIPSAQIEAIRQATDIVKLVGETVRLKRQGRSFVACCPFHQERTPSFSVTPDKGMFYCFGCHVGGDVFAFVMQTQGLDFGSAARLLAERSGVQLAPLTPQQTARRAHDQRLCDTLEALQKILVATLWGPEGRGAQRYLAERGVPAAQARKTGLGLGLSDAALWRALKAEKVSEEALVEAGVLADGSGHILLAERLTLPIHDPSGRLIGLGGRRLGSKNNGPKYLQSRDTALLKKRETLFGWVWAQARIRQTQRAVLVEGFFDVLAAQRAKVEETVATLGTQLTQEHIVQLRRLANDIVLLFDGDGAGLRAGMEAAAKLLATGATVRCALLPPGEDPDSFVRQHPQGGLAQRVADAPPIIDMALSDLEQVPARDVTARGRAAERAMRLIAAMPAGVTHDLYIGRLAAALKLTDTQLRHHLTRLESERRDQQAKLAQKEQPKRVATQTQKTPKSRTHEPSNQDHALVDYELGLIRELLLFPQLAPRLTEICEYLFVSAHQELLEDLARAAGNEQHVGAAVVRHGVSKKWQTKLQAVAPLAQQSPHLSSQQLDDQANRTFNDILRRLKWRHVDAALRCVLGELAQAEAHGEATDLLLRRKQDLSARKRALATPGSAGE